MIAKSRFLVAFLLLICSAQSNVLDPALYLSPSPPMTASSSDVTPGDLWTQSLAARRERDAENFVVPEHEETKDEPKELTGKAKSFWPALHSADYTLRGLHIPLTFSISGRYGSSNGGLGTGVIGGSYASISSDDSSLFGSYGKAALAGSSYGNYGTGYPGVRVFGSGTRSGWGGWGNGKWGHYGKG